MIINKVFKILKSEGYYGVHKRIKNKMRTRAYGYRLNLDDFNYEVNNEYVFTLLNNELLEKMYDEYKDEIDERKYNILKNKINNKCYESYVVINKDNQICGYFHIAYKDIIDTCVNSNISIDNETIYLFDDYTFKKHRKRGVHKFSVCSRLKIGKEKRYKYAIVNILDGTIASERTYKKYGFGKYIKYDYYHIGSIKKTYIEVR